MAFSCWPISLYNNLWTQLLYTLLKFIKYSLHLQKQRLCVNLVLQFASFGSYLLALGLVPQESIHDTHDIQCADELRVGICVQAALGKIGQINVLLGCVHVSKREVSMRNVSQGGCNPFSLPWCDVPIGGNSLVDLQGSLKNVSTPLFLSKTAVHDAH